MAGNHVILMLPTEKETIWLENTSQTIAYNHLSYSSLDRNELALSDSDVKLTNTPSYKPEDSKEMIKAIVKINLDNSIDVSSKFQFTGSQYDYQLPITTLKKEEVIDYIKENYSNLKFEKLNVENVLNDRDEALVNYDLNFKAKEYSKKLGEDLFFRAIPFLDSTPYTSTEERKLPFEISSSFLDAYEFEFEIPTGYKISEIPKSIALNSEFGDYSLQFKEENGKIKVLRSLSLKKQIAPKEKYQDYLNFRKKTINFDNTKLLITNSN